jgi:histidine triad (HIT) family protein
MMKKDENCIFCKIIDGKIPSAKVYEDEKVLAFLDITPVNKGHTLVVPKNHSKNILEDDDKDIDSCMRIVKKIGKGVMKAMKAQGFNIGVNTERAAGQAVFHTHFHVIPRFEDDGLHHWPGGKYPEGEMEKVRKSILSSLER